MLPSPPQLLALSRLVRCAHELMPLFVEFSSRRFVCCPPQVCVILITVHREEHMRRGVGSARCLLRLRYLPPLQLAVVSRFSLRCWPSATKAARPRRSGRRPIPATSPGRDRMPLGWASGAIVRLVAYLDDTPPLD